MNKKIVFFMALAAVLLVVSGCGAKKAVVIEEGNVNKGPSINSFGVSQEPVPAKTPKVAPVPEPTPAQSATSSATSTDVAQIVKIEIKDFAFNPAEVAVAVGSTVVWTNSDAISHEIKSATFSSPSLDKGGKFEQKFAAAGTYEYSCLIHPSMKGKIIVK